MASFAEEIGSRLVGVLPRDNVVQESELDQQTVIEHAPEAPRRKPTAHWRGPSKKTTALPCRAPCHALGCGSWPCRWCAPDEADTAAFAAERARRTRFSRLSAEASGS